MINTPCLSMPISLSMSEVSDQYSMLEHAYQSIQNVFSTTSEGKLVGGDGSLNQLESLPSHWPLAKLTLPLKFGVNRLDGLLVGYLMELRATHSDPSRCRRQISSFAKTLTVRVATYLSCQGNCCTIPPCIISPPHVPY